MSKATNNKASVIDVVIETPKGSRNKYTFQPESGQFRLKKILPLGAVFPYDFGFLPETEGGDGDPLDVLVFMDESGFPGCVVSCRMIGIIKARQTEKGKTIRNDRLIAVSQSSISYSKIRSINDLSSEVLSEIEHFFISYNEQEGKKFVPYARGDSKEALELIQGSEKNSH